MLLLSLGYSTPGKVSTAPWLQCRGSYHLSREDTEPYTYTTNSYRLNALVRYNAIHRYMVVYTYELLTFLRIV